MAETERGSRLEGRESEAATALVLAYLLSDTDVRARGRAGADRFRARLASGRAWDADELAGVLADADVVMGPRRNDIDVADGDGDGDGEGVRVTLSAAGVSPEAAARATDAVAATARMRALARALDGPERAAAFERRRRGASASTTSLEWQADELARSEVARAAAAAAMARAAASALDERLEALADVVTVLAAELRSTGREAPGGDKPSRVAERLAARAAERRRRADRLAALLLARAKPETVPVLPSAPPAPDQLAWLRGILGQALYTSRDAEDGANWLGSDPFRLRELPPAPSFLADVDTASLPAELIVPLLRRIDLNRPEPAAADLSLASLRRDAAAVSRCARSPEAQRWIATSAGDDAGAGAAARNAPLLPPVTEIPRILHAIWLGGAPPADSPFLRNLGYAARTYADEIEVVLWTDLPRATIADPDDDAARGLSGWARANGVPLLNVFEVFHAEAPMITHAQFVLEMCKQLPGGYAAASDLLRLEIVERFGGIYADGDLEYAGRQHTDPVPGATELVGPRVENLVEFLDRLSSSALGFTMDPLPAGGIGNDVVAGPARHPAIRLWLEETRVNYFRSHAQIFGGLPAMALPYVGQDRCAMRYVAPNRTGRVHHHVLGVLGLTGPDLPATQPPFRFNSVGSWIRQETGHGGVPAADEERVVAVLARCLTFLEWQVTAREGDLYLAAIAPVVAAAALPDQDGAAWTALLTALSALISDRPGRGASVTSVTDVRRRDDRVVERVELPPEAQALIVRHAITAAREPAADWLGAGLVTTSKDGDDPGCVWLVDDRVEPARLRDSRGPVPALLDMLRPLAEVAYDLLGRPIGLWIRPEASARRWRRPERFALVPRGRVGVSLGGPPGWDWCTQWPLCPETVAELLLGAGAADRPVLLSAPWGGEAAAAAFGRRLSALLDQPVDVVEGPLRPPTVKPGLGPGPGLVSVPGPDGGRQVTMPVVYRPA